MVMVVFGSDDLEHGKTGEWARRGDWVGWVVSLLHWSLEYGHASWECCVCVSECAPFMDSLFAFYSVGCYEYVRRRGAHNRPDVAC
jgi:hypothetical protein